MLRDPTKLLDDFVLGDRRIAERRDIKVIIHWIEDWPGPRIDLLQGLSFDARAKKYSFVFATPKALGVVEIVIDQQLSDTESKLIRVLAPLAALLESHVLRRRLFEVPWKLGTALGEVRESLGISAAALSQEIGISRNVLSRWEVGKQRLGVPGMYRWCQALGLVCPPKTALVRVVNFSPELLQVLKEDPVRLQALTPGQFEQFIAERLDRMGYNVTLTGATSRKDGGIDLIATPKMATVGSVVIAGQMKHHRDDQKTGRHSVDRLLAWKDSYFGVGLLVTNTGFTHDAVWAAQQERNRHFLRLRGFTDLKRWLEERFGEDEDWREIPDRIELAPGVFIEIPRPKITSDFDLLRK